MKDSPRQQFRSAPHVAGTASVKRKDYDEDGSLEAANDYDAWQQLRAGEHPLQVGDLLETDTGALRICKYVGFEAAQWFLPEPKTAAEDSATPEPAQPTA